MTKLNQQVNVELKNKLIITSQMKQALQVLAMPQIELNKYINQMIEENIFLQSKDDFDLIDSQEKTSNIDEIPSELDFDCNWNEIYPDHKNDFEEEINHQENLAYSISLNQHLNQQLELLTLDEKLYFACQIIIDCLNDDGYFLENLADLSKEYDIEIDIFNKALTIVQSFSPSGIGARNLSECLLLQYQQLSPTPENNRIIKIIIQRHLQLLNKNHQLIAKKINTDIKTVDYAFKIIKSLNPTPALGYQNNQVEFIKPDIIVLEKNGISYLDSNVTTDFPVCLNQEYLSLFNNTNLDNKDLLNAQLSQAKFFLNALDKRNKTLMKVASIVVSVQQDFFQQGKKALKKLTRKQVAQILNVHESTVVRTINGKYLQCKLGVFELKEFFSHAITNNQNHSKEAVKIIIAQIIKEENGKKPLSDMKITQILAEKNIQISRRTVTKYREKLKIPDSNNRRK